MARKHNIQKVHKGRSYNTEEISTLLGVHIQTIRTWRKQGLQSIDKTKSPYLFYGEDIQTFLKKQSLKTKVKLQPNELYCFKCRKGVIPPMITYIETGVILGGNMLSYTKVGNCPICNIEVRRYATKPNLVAIDTPQLPTAKKNSKPESMYSMSLFESGGDG